MDVSTQRRRQTGLGSIATGAALVLASGLWFQWVSSSGAHEWLSRNAPAIYTRSECADYRLLFFVIGGALCVVGAVVGFRSFRGTSWGVRWLGLAVAFVGVVAALAWATGFVLVGLLARCSD